MRYLIAESVALKPHLETAGELALRFRDEGSDPVFAWLGAELPWSDWNLPVGAGLLGCSLARRVTRFEGLLRRQGLRVLAVPTLEPTLARSLREWAEAFKGDMEALKSYTLDGAALGMGVASSLISLHGDSRYVPTADLAEVRRALYAAALVFERSRAAIAAAQPDVVVTFNGRFATSRPIAAATELLGLPVLRHERGSTFRQYEVFSDALHNYAYIRERIQQFWDATPSPKRETAGHEFFRRRRGGDGIGWYSFTVAQERGELPARAPGRRRVVYYSSSDDEYAAVSDVFEAGPWPDQLTAVGDLIAACDALPDIELIVRVHPHLAKKSSGERARWKAFSGRNLTVIDPEARTDSYALLDSADIVVSYGSTMGMEAAYWGKPSVLIGPCAYAGSPAVISVGSEDELRKILSSKTELLPSSQELCLPYGNYYMSYGVPFRYYEPSSLSEGELLGDRLGWDPDIIHWLRKQGFGRCYRRIFCRRG